ncbi:hypothetical protein VFPPC_01025 [Pochonia chlamydosporia 170]|uniref:Uncharacterized protein n=1 Tax=Pochonia chlamydosporia 170 TaxID=1380566 RepID=A0A179G616_METCM|nr:hypothetical protein VFPPC_01025 [Pochonia chlamydosporia 170]OAQ73272.2 hypothetical protein VFPPC_01025 [Pochonia chlamydosporia 170]
MSITDLIANRGINISAAHNRLSKHQIAPHASHSSTQKLRFHIAIRVTPKLKNQVGASSSSPRIKFAVFSKALARRFVAILSQPARSAYSHTAAGSSITPLTSGQDLFQHALAAARVLALPTHVLKAALHTLKQSAHDVPVPKAPTTIPPRTATRASESFMLRRGENDVGAGSVWMI